MVFIKEIVPKPALAFVANAVYKENYETLPMNHEWSETEEERLVEYRWKKGSKWQTFRVKARKQATQIKSDSETEFTTEHYWGYARVSGTRTNEYEVTHPRWLAYDVLSYTIDVDFGEVYGAEFAFLNGLSPVSVMLAEGS